jgi:hypothetical protein
LNDDFNDEFLERLLARAEETDSAFDSAPTRLQSRIYSALMLAQAAEGPLRSLSETEACGRDLCVFEKLVEITPVPEDLQSFNYCRVCHGRIMGERIEDPPLYWAGCPYAQFKPR